MKNTYCNKYMIIMALCIFMPVIFAATYYSMAEKYSIDSINKIRTIYAERTEYFINNVFHKTDVLAAAVSLTNGNISEALFNQIARITYKENSGIRGVQYMPGAVVTYSYPVEGNEEVIGKNFLTIPERKKDVQLAIDTRSIALSGPYHLIQGGLGLVARNPVFLQDEQGKEYFWGFSAIVLDLPQAIEAVGLGNLPESGYDFQLFCVNENNEHIVIAGNSSLDINKAVVGTIHVPHHTWTIAIRELSPWILVAKTGAVLCLGLLISSIMWLLYSEKQRNDALVKSKELFFSTISHDMRTPLNAVLGFSKLAQAQGTSIEEKDKFLRKIQSSGQLLLELLNDTLTISKLRNGKFQQHVAEFSVEMLLDSILEPVRAIATQKNINLSVDKSRLNLQFIEGDQLNLQKIFLNILNNAIKFTPSGGLVQVTVSGEAQGEAARLCITVCDRGIGISPEFLPHIFEPFSQEYRKGFELVGTGLGLTIVKQLIDQMKGTINVESEVNKGSKFTVCLPFAKTDGSLLAGKSLSDSVDISLLKGKTVLLCEDNSINREIALAILQRKGMVVESAENGRVCAEKFAASSPGFFDIILMDIRMPVMDGYMATHEIRGMKRADARSIPIIAMTADAFPDDIQKCLQAGMNGHIAKPLDFKLLYRLLAVNIQRRQEESSLS